MKQLLLYLHLLLLCLFISACSDSPKDPINSKLFSGHICVDKASMSFGVVNRNEMNKICCKFKLKNTGQLPVVISKIDVSCGCIAAGISSDTILPNRNQLLTVTLNPNSSIGYLNKTIFVNSDADNPVLLLRVKGKIIE